MKNKVQSFLLLFTASMLLSNCTNKGREQTTETDKEYTKYELVADWPQLPEGYNLGQVTGVDIDSGQNIFLIHRAWRRWKILNEVFPDTTISAHTILELDRSSGKLLNSWGAGLFIMPHGLAVDKENNIWVTDVGMQQVFKFSHEGKLLMTLGEARKPGNDSLHFNYPTDVASAPDGSIYVSDGYRNSRVVKFSREGKYLFEWGKKGTGEGEFDTPHAIDVDSRGNVYVADRENNRIQKFDAAGKFIKQWKNDVAKQLFSLSVDPKNDNLFAVDYLTVDTLIKGADIILFDSTIKYLQRFGRSGSYDGPVCWYHDITIDAEGNIYVGDILGNQIQKFRPTSN